MSFSDDDELVARVAAIEPARGTPTLSKSSIYELIHAVTSTHQEARPWTWARFQLASLGALLGSGALVIAGILGLDAAGTSSLVAPSVSMTRFHPAVGSILHGDSVQSVLADGGAAYFSSPAGVHRAVGCPVALTLLATATMSRFEPVRAGAFQITSPLSPRQALSALAPSFGLTTAHLMWYPIGARSKAWWVGSLDGPSLTTFSSVGITWWSYAGPRETTRQLVREAGPSGRRLPSDRAASFGAVRLLSRLGVVGHLGTSVASRTATSVEVSVPLTAHGLASDERYDITFGARGRVAAAEGPILMFAREVAYPVISSARATQLLRRPVGVLVGLAAPTGTTNLPTRRRVAPTAVCTTPTAVIPVASASMTLSTRELSNGHVWLLPSWAFSARPASAPSSAAASLVAINPRYLEYTPVVVRYRRHTTGP